MLNIKRRKLNNKFLELQDQYNELMNKYSNSEKNKLRLQAQVDNLITDLDSVSVLFYANFLKKIAKELNDRDVDAVI